MAVTIECDLRHLFGPARDQGPRPTCLAFAASDAHAAARDGWEPLSCEYAYFNAIRRDGSGPADGATPSGMLTAIREDGQPPETAWAYLPATPSDLRDWKPPAKAGPLFRRASVYDTARIAAVRRRLDDGAPVLVTMCLSDAFYMPGAEGVIASQEAPDPKRRHAVVAVGYGTRAGTSLILVRNSWGAGWGIDGHAWVSETYMLPRIVGFAEMKEDLTNVSASNNKTNMRSGVA